MTSAELKQAVESYRASLVANSGKPLMISPKGPANMGLIDALVAYTTELEERITDLEKRLK